MYSSEMLIHEKATAFSLSDGDNNYIAGFKTPADWKKLRVRLEVGELNAWREAFEDYFLKRLELRYLSPIKVLQEYGTYQGEGFSIVAIQCSLIEFLESTAQGKSYKYRLGNEVLSANEYSSSQSIFVGFLKARNPFAGVFDGIAAKDFYVSVRCGLLHEARTKNGWRIWAESSNGILADLQKRIVYRNNFQAGLLLYIKQYGEALMGSPILQQGFIRKFDSLCK